MTKPGLSTAQLIEMAEYNHNERLMHRYDKKRRPELNDAISVIIVVSVAIALTLVIVCGIGP